MPDVETDLRIHYRVVGDGPPLLWHTGGCGDGQMWQLRGTSMACRATHTW